MIKLETTFELNTNGKIALAEKHPFNQWHLDEFSSFITAAANCYFHITGQLHVRPHNNKKKKK